MTSSQPFRKEPPSPFLPPAIPGIGTSGGVTFILQDRASRDVEFLADNTERFPGRGAQRPELPPQHHAPASVPQVYVDVDRDAVIAQGVDLPTSTGPCRPSWAAHS